MDPNFVQPVFKAGKNIAMKVPPDQFDPTVSFYRDALGLALLESYLPEIVFEFGEMRLWIDPTENLSRGEIWLEILTADTEAADRYFESEGIMRRDEVESLPEDFRGFWISNAAGIIHLIAKE